MRPIAWILFAAVAISTLVPPGLRPVSGMPRLAEHFLLFAVAGCAFAIGYTWRALGLCVIAFCVAAALEIMQVFVPGRHARLSDFLADFLGACLGIVLGKALHYRSTISHPRDGQNIRPHVNSDASSASRHGNDI